ncbi:hypothetical protein ACQP2U_42600 (plasmid) [Nocardia sp. CA-084685]|uniref:hypothetical protein n=1 Tax=Nocardia sp. CA-084685 TaxID=3239970 RepID=UPI003D977E31
MSESIALKTLLQENHQNEYSDFVIAYKRHATGLGMQGTEAAPPSRTQYHRWLRGEGGLPRSRFCRVLTSMFPGWTVEELFSPVDNVAGHLKQRTHNEFGDSRFAGAVANAMAIRDINVTGWGRPRLPPADSMPNTPPMPVTASGLGDADLPEHTRLIGKKLAALSKVLRLDNIETVQLAGLVGNVVELEHRIEIDVDKTGRARLTYTHDMFNMSNAPLTRVARQLWFEHTDPGGLRIEPLRRDHRQVTIDRTHDTGTLAKFSCQLSPAIEPGETGTLSYTCIGGRFVDHLYWRQDIVRFTRAFTMRLRQAGGYRLVTCSGEEVKPSGAQVGATEDLLWDYSGDDDVEITLTRDYLQPTQSVTLRWEFDRGLEPAPDDDNA